MSSVVILCFDGTFTFTRAGHRGQRYRAHYHWKWKLVVHNVDEKNGGEVLIRQKSFKHMNLSPGECIGGVTGRW
jgi:hypothetical protein